ncbi:hypothetical protein EW146_g6326 [Bondarzewia mesenterica]|uniref:Protein-S-isoprenylcysteine O-methyltransferase n=1 Tax=Bondarzewia mesenterica TaxID=1095465 RepID=A0A4S4LPI4_9AGAM|nr:hypothetical protein EW146_g6326 [Bondarzewia mesenterica]
MSLFKIPLLLTSAISSWRALTPPYTPKKDEKMKPSINERVGKKRAVHVLFFLKVRNFLSLVVHMLTCLGETIMIVSCHTQENSLSRYLLHILSHATPHEPYGASSSSAAANIRITPIFLAAFFFITVGAQIRLACYRMLGRFFTFELALRTNHQLITDGPYRYVRHPAYSGVIMVMLAEPLAQCCEGSWLRECGWLQGVLPVKIYVAVMVGLVVSVLVCTK